MIRTTLISALLVVIALQPGRTQDRWPVYRQFLPASAESTSTIRDQITILLDAKSKVHPELAFYYLAYYGVVLSDSAASLGVNRAEWPSRLASIERSYLGRRSSWMSQQRALVDSIESALEVRAILSALFAGNEPARDSAWISPFQLTSSDSAKMNYLIIQLISPDNFIAFDPDAEYRLRRERIQFRLKDSIITALLARANGEPARESFLSSELLPSWHLFEDSDHTQDTPLVHKLARALNRTGSIDPGPQFGLSFLFSPVDYLFTFDYSATLKGAPQELDLSQQCHGMSVGLSLNYRIPTRQYFGSFSYIEFRLQGFLMLTTPTMTLFSGYEQHGTERGFNSVMRLTLRGGHLSASSLSALLIRCSAPIVVLFGRHPVELALHLGATRIAYSLQYDYRYIHWLFSSSWQNISYASYDTRSTLGTGTIVQWRVVVSPSINFGFYAGDLMSVSVSLGLRGSYLSFDLHL